jgi:hypothetical protein
MTDSRKKSVTHWIVETESIRLTNWSIRTTWKTAACVTAVTARVSASTILALARLAQRRRNRW